MKRATNKSKVVTENQKISTFFKKWANNATSKEKNANDNVIVVDSDEDVIPVTPHAPKSRRKRVLSPITNLKGEHSRKRKHSGENTEAESKKFNSSENIRPSRISLVDPKKLLDEAGNFHQEEKLVQTKKEIGDVTPKKGKNNETFVAGEKSKSKGKNPGRTPKKKLFENSPEVNEFKVEVLKNFIKVTPSKSNKRIIVITPVKSNEKKQKSILNYISPSASSSRSVRVQSENESTPTKTPSKEAAPTSARIKIKLDFENLSKVTVKTERTPISDHKPTIEIQESLRKESNGNIFDENAPPTTEGIIENENTQTMDDSLENFMANSTDFLDDSWDNLEISQDSYTLDLSKPQHVKVVSYDASIKNRIEMVVQSTKSKEKAECILEGFWICTKLEIGSVLYLNATRHHEQWKLTNEEGLLVYEPDLLVSSTSVVGALFCKRRSIFKEKFLGYEPQNKVMIVGILVHTLLENVLKSNADTIQKIETILRALLTSREMVRTLYEASLTLEEVRNEVMVFVPRVLEFMHDYVIKNRKFSTKAENWVGHIDAVQDVEENIWCNELGMKGKVDVSVTVGGKVMPLELKTGRATMSLEHRGQVIMYMMMMLKLGYTVSSGLLLYLRDGTLREIPFNPREQRDIMLLRNELTYYLSKKTEITRQETQNGASQSDHANALKLQQLPDPINHHSGCDKCPYKIICCSYLKHQNYGLSKYKRLKTISDEVLAHLSDAHIEYFVHWCNLIDLEGVQQVGKNLRTIYTVPAKEREEKGRCITSLRITDCIAEGDGMYKQTFKRVDSSHTSTFLTSGLSESSYVVVSTDKRPAVSSGLVTFVDHDSITVTLERNLMERYSDSTFHVDSYDSNTVNSLNLANLSLLLEPTDRAERLRSLIIDKEKPTFRQKLPQIVANEAPAILRTMNKVQQRAVLRSLSANDYVLIKGMPGTGKTATIVALVRLLTKIGQTVLITSHTHSAVDNVCLRLKKCGLPVLRLGSQGRIHAELREISEYELTKNCNTPEQLEQVYNDARILAATCLGSKHPALGKRAIDVCIVDESTQVLQCSVLRALTVAKKFILVGDPDQLPPVVKSKEATAQGMSESLFERLQTVESIVALSLNYRMNKTITKLANAFMYNGELQVANDAVGNACLSITNQELLSETYKEQKWVLDALDGRLEGSVKILDTGSTYNLDLRPKWLEKLVSTFDGEQTMNCTNPWETAIVVTLIDALIMGGVSRENIGIIGPYRAQVAQLSTVLQSKGVDVSTVDQFQGKDKSVIIYSCTKSVDIKKISNITKFDILEDKRRLNVAITRAKHKFLLLGDLGTIARYSPFAKLIENVESEQFLKLEDGKNGFEWKKLVDISL